MRQRITYLLPEGTELDPGDVKVGRTEIFYKKVEQAAEENRITLGLSELPEDLRVFLEDFHELHIRVASPRNANHLVPTISRVPPGVHAFFTPRKPGHDTNLCSALRGVLGEAVKCSNASESFSKPPILSERFASSSTFQFYHGPDGMERLSRMLESAACEETSTLQTLCNAAKESSAASYLDFDFDVISHALTVTALRPSSNGAPGRSKRGSVRKLNPDDRVEVGILQAQKAEEPEELSLGGLLTVLGDDDHPSPTLFSFPARHHPLHAGDGTQYTVAFQQPTGLHPKLDIVLPAKNLAPPKDSCALHAYWTLPSPLFIDRYQLSDHLFLESQNLVALRALSGEQDLEAPDWAVKGWGSAALLELARPTSAEEGKNWTITIPTHLRYINATASPDGLASVEIPWPVVFWACEAQEGLKMSVNPFDRVNLGYDGLFGPKTMFYHVPPASGVGVLVETLAVPVLDGQSAQWVPLGTAIAVLIGFGWICWQMVGRSRSTATSEKDKKVR
ncbi:related to pbn1 [Lecanosticta acicola]|uniref:Protein PBN1 n=1 Tax=Lecanosticta acicola TaxID=111012 RepID=A0AAI8YSU5_9PEZI|nr:related to pbn1 [Lecanosticta acicola]